MMFICPICNAPLSQQEHLCLETGSTVVQLRCQGCRHSWPSLEEFQKVQRRSQAVQDLPDQICRVCGQDAPPDELWSGLSGDAGVCRHCRQCPGCGGVLFRREPTQVVCENCGSHWHDGLEFAQDFVPRAHIFQ